MTKFLDKSFSSRPTTDAYRKGWGETFSSRSNARRVAAMKGEPAPTFERLKPHPKQAEFMKAEVGPIWFRGSYIIPPKRKAKKR